MALAKTDNSIESIRGRYGGIYYKKDNAGQHVQAMPRHVYNTFGGTLSAPVGGTKTQRIINILAFTKAARAWASLVGTLVVAGFGNIAELWLSPKKNSLYKKLNAYQWWLLFNVMRIAKDLPPYTLPPRKLLDPPDHVITGTHWGKNTINMYRSGLYHEGYIFSRMQENPWQWDECYLFHHGDSWYISPVMTVIPQPPYWRKVGEDQEGIYDPSSPDLDLAYVNY
jgi:hypothetical protein